MAVKVTKSQIIKELNSLKLQQMNVMRDNHCKQRETFKLNLVREKYGNDIQEIVNQLVPVLNKWVALQDRLREDVDIDFYYYTGSNTFENKFVSEEQALKFIKSCSYFDKGEYIKFSDILSKQYYALEEEWDKLIAYLKSLPLAEVKEFIIENNFELECMKEKEETRIVKYDINFNLLWGETK